jgi:Resolvase, N terminal domain
VGAAGDLLIVTKLDRLARSTRDLLNTIAAITGKDAGRLPRCHTNINVDRYPKVFNCYEYFWKSGILSDVVANSELNLLSELLREGAAPRYWLPPYRGFFFLPLNGLILWTCSGRY